MRKNTKSEKITAFLTINLEKPNLKTTLLF